MQNRIVKAKNRRVNVDPLGEFGALNEAISSSESTLKSGVTATWRLTTDLFRSVP